MYAISVLITSDHISPRKYLLHPRKSLSKKKEKKLKNYKIVASAWNTHEMHEILDHGINLNSSILVTVGSTLLQTYISIHNQVRHHLHWCTVLVFAELLSVKQNLKCFCLLNNFMSLEAIIGIT